MKSKYEILKVITKNTEILWKNVKGIASQSVSDKMDIAMLDWLVQLTECLEIWSQKGTSMTDGELILARTNLGTIVEAWMKFFYCVHYEDYLKNPAQRNGSMIEPENMTFERLKSYSTGILWDDIKSDWYIWIERVQHRRNAVHSFLYREIGTPAEFVEDVEKLCDFVEMIQACLPDVVDSLGYYPAGYIVNPYFKTP